MYMYIYYVINFPRSSAPQTSFREHTHKKVKAIAKRLVQWL